MPRLLRMPIVYVVLILGIGLAAATRSRTTRPSPPFRQTPGPATPASISPAPSAPPSPVQPPPPDPIARTPEGLRRKVLVRTPDARCFDRPVGGEPQGPPLDYYSIHFVRGQTPPGPEPRFEIGPEQGPAEGWVPARAVLEWDSRLMAVPTPRAGRSTRLLVYREEACARDIAATGRCNRHAPSTCPLEAEEPDTAADVPTPLGLPILRSEVVASSGAGPATIHEVACLVRDLLPLPPPSEPPPEMVEPLRQVYLAFVIDTTQSMELPIEAVKAFARRLATETSAPGSPLTFHLALVAYRDRAPVFRFTTRRVSDFTSPDRFAATLDDLASAPGGDGSNAESVLEGIAAALPGGAAGLSWPTGAEAAGATRLLVLIGDAPDHATTLEEPRRIADQARRDEIGIAAVGVEPPVDRRVLSRTERRRFADQWQALAEGSYRPVDPAGAAAAPLLATLALDAPADGADQVVDSVASGIRHLVADRLARALQLAAQRQAENERRLREYRTRADLPLTSITPVLVDTHQTEREPKARPDPRVGGVRAPSLRQGWIVESRDGPALVTLEVLLSRAELDTLIREYLAVQAAAAGSPEDLDRLVGIGAAAAAGETSFLAQDRGRLTFDEHLRRLQGLPPGRPDSLLRQTRTDLLRADEPTRASLAERLGAAVGQLVRRRFEIPWDDPARTPSGLALIPYAWIDL